MIWMLVKSARWCQAQNIWMHPGDVAAVSAAEAVYWRRGHAVDLVPQPAEDGPLMQVRTRRKLLKGERLVPEGTEVELPQSVAEALLAIGVVEDPQAEPQPEPQEETTPAETAPSSPAPVAVAFYYKGEEARLVGDAVVDLTTKETFATESAWKAAVTRRQR